MSRGRSPSPRLVIHLGRRVSRLRRSTRSGLRKPRRLSMHAAFGQHGKRGQLGLTLLEVVLAISILAVIIVVATASLRVGLHALEAGQRRAAGNQEVRFVTTAPPLVLEFEAAPFHAVVLQRTNSGTLRLVEVMVPTDEPFGEGATATISRSVTALRLQYLDDKGLWQDHWDGATAAGLPLAVQVEVTVRSGDRTETLPPFVIRMPLGKSATS